jgi:short subunit dehydrogenase-like uncharacterized protein
MLYGTELVATCAYSGTNYADTTGEDKWVGAMIEQFDEVARKTGAKIVSHCAHDSVPYDLTVFMLNKKLK